MSIASARKEFEAQVEELFSNVGSRPMSSHSQLSVCSRQRSDPSLSLMSFHDSFNNSGEETPTRDAAAASPEKSDLGNVRRMKKLYEEKLRRQELEYGCWLDSKDHEILKLQREVGRLNDILLSHDQSTQTLRAAQSEEAINDIRFQLEVTENEIVLLNAKNKLLEEEIKSLGLKEEATKAHTEELVFELKATEEDKQRAITNYLEMESTLKIVREQLNAEKLMTSEQQSELVRLKSVEKQHLTLGINYDNLKKDYDELFKELNMIKQGLDSNNNQLDSSQLNEISATVLEIDEDIKEHQSQESHDINDESVAENPEDELNKSCFELKTQNDYEESEDAKDLLDFWINTEPLHESHELLSTQDVQEEEVGSLKQNEASTALDLDVSTFSPTEQRQEPQDSTILKHNLTSTEVILEGPVFDTKEDKTKSLHQADLFSPGGKYFPHKIEFKDGKPILVARLLDTREDLLEERLHEISELKTKNELLSSQITTLQEQLAQLSEDQKTFAEESVQKPLDTEINEHLERAFCEMNWRENSNYGAMQYPHLHHLYPSGIPGADNSTQSDPDLDAVYFRSVMFKFLTNTDPYVTRQLTKIVSGVLQLSGEEERLMYKSLEAKGWTWIGY